LPISGMPRNITVSVSRF